MATAKPSGPDSRAEDDDPERTQRLPATKGAVDRWFSDSDRGGDKPPAGGGR